MNDIRIPIINSMEKELNGGFKEKKIIHAKPSEESDSSKPSSSESSIVKGNTAVNQMDINDVFKLMDLYFHRSGIMYTHLYNSFNKLLDEDIKIFLNTSDNTFFEKVTKDKVIRYKFEYSNIAVRPPMLPNEDELMFPSDARNRSITYSSKLIATVTQIQEIIDMSTDEVERKVIGTPENEFPVMFLPIMVRSGFCSLNIKKGYDKSECEYDPGGYFIVYGSEKVVISQDRMCENKPMVFLKKDSGAESHVVQVNSRSHRNSRLLQVIAIKIKKDNTMSVKVPIISEIPIFILLRALGIESDRDIIDYIVYNEKDLDMINMIRMSLDATINDKGVKVQTQEDAIEYLLTKMRVIKKYSETDKTVKQQQKKLHLISLLENNFLPHVEGGLLYKAYYIGYMIHRLLKCYLGRILPDDRDSYINKRVDMIGNLLEELISQHYRKMLNECNKYFKKRNTNDDTPLNIINQIKPTIIEQGLRIALMTGSWGRKKGVAQMLQRLSFKQLISFLRRIDSPSVDSSTNKLTSPRQLHPSSLGMCCCLTGDTEVLLADGTIKQIKDIKNGEVVTSVHKDELIEEPTPIYNWFKKMPETSTLLKLTTITGRTIKCTHDHKLLTLNERNKYDFKEVQHMAVNDYLVVKHMPIYLHPEKETVVELKYNELDDKYKMDILEAGLAGKQIPQQILEIIARLLGASITDGHIGMRDNGCYDASFFVGEDKDKFDLINDIKKLNFGSPSASERNSIFTNKSNGKQTEYHTYCVSKNGAFAYFMSLMGGFVGKKTEMIRELPQWLLDSNKPIKREFLAGLMGGDGCKISMQKNESRYKISMNQFTQATSPELIEHTKKYINQIISLFKDFDIECGLHVRDELDDNGKSMCAINFSNSYENLEKMSNVIGYRYCEEKRRKSAPVSEYIRYKNHIAESKQEKYNTIEKLYKLNKKPAEIVAETGFEYQLVKRILENLHKGNVPTPRETNGTTTCIPYDEFLQKYYINNDKLIIPIESIEEIPAEPVYDFTTMSNSHSFIVGGIVTSNCVETPEHANVGLVKHLSMLANITIIGNSQLNIIKGYLRDKLINIRDVRAIKLKEYTKVFVNGEWLGLSDKPFELEGELRYKKLHGSFDTTIGIVHDIKNSEIKIYCDCGRIYRPVITVNNNIINLTRDLINKTSLNKADSSKITDWNEFMLKNPGIIEYIDMEEQPYCMIAPGVQDVEEMRQTMLKSVDLVKNVKDNTILNRYDDMKFVRYTHCEFHPSLLLGTIATNIPFCNHNAGPRNIFQYAQGTGCTGGNSNYLHRMNLISVC